MCSFTLPDILVLFRNVVNEIQSDQLIDYCCIIC